MAVIIITVNRRNAEYSRESSATENEMATRKSAGKIISVIYIYTYRNVCNGRGVIQTSLSVLFG